MIWIPIKQPVFQWKVGDPVFFLVTSSILTITRSLETLLNSVIQWISHPPTPTGKHHQAAILRQIRSCMFFVKDLLLYIWMLNQK